MTNRKLTSEAEPLTREEAAGALRVSLSTVDRYMRDGTLPKVRVGKRLVRIPADAVAALLTVDEQPQPTASLARTG